MGKFISPAPEVLLNKDLARKFEKMGARVKVAPFDDRALRRAQRSAAVSPATVDIGHDRRGEFFDVRHAPGDRPLIDAIDVRPNLRHLVLQVTPDEGTASRFLCGHDERAWFVAAVPGGSGGSANVEAAMQALKPQQVVVRERAVGLKKARRHKRRNAAFVRQGEWFFIPVPQFAPADVAIQKNRPLSRGARSKPHVAEFACESGGEIVYVNAEHPQGLSRVAYQRIIRRRPKLAGAFTPMRRNPGVFVRGRVRHADHKTLVLRQWHQVVMNTEHLSPAMRHVVFLD